MSTYLTTAQKTRGVDLAARHLLDVLETAELAACEVDDGYCITHVADTDEPTTCELGNAIAVLRKALDAPTDVLPISVAHQFATDGRARS